MERAFIVVAFLLLQAAAPQKPMFEVSSVKAHDSSSGFPLINGVAGRFVATNVTLRLLMTYAYRHPGDQELLIIGAPGWADSDRFDIEGKPEDRTIPQQQVILMLQSLLEDRFALKVHREARVTPVYILSVGKDGPKFKPSADQTPIGAAPAPASPSPPGAIQTPFGPIAARPQTPASSGTPRGMIRATGSDLINSAVTFDFFANFLARNLGRPVVNQTNLTGLFDFTLHWVPDPLPPGFNPAGPLVPVGPNTSPANDTSAASIFSSLQEVGLKLESAKVPLEVLVVDSVQKPSKN